MWGRESLKIVPIKTKGSGGVKFNQWVGSEVSLLFKLSDGLK